MFFFSSRRRHTRFDCDWSSDVCSSDLEVRATIPPLDKAAQKSFLRPREAAYHALADMLIEQGRLSEAEQVVGFLKDEERSEERRVGKECRSGGGAWR